MQTESVHTGTPEHDSELLFSPALTKMWFLASVPKPYLENFARGGLQKHSKKV